MKIDNLPDIFVDAMPVIKRLKEAGFEAYFVGGAVRDLLLKRKIHDIDIATSAYPQEVKQIFAKVIDTGIKHGTVTVLYQGGSYEITTFRTESEYQDFRRPSHVTFVQSLSEDLKRRDFTINALAMNAQGEIIDLFGGLDDLKNNLLKAVGDPNKRFSEDALRMMRAVRFVSQLEFNLARNTQEAITKNHELLKKISIERIRDEFVKLGIGRNAKQAFNVFLETGLYNDVPEFIDKRDALEVFPKLNFVPISEVNFWSTIIIILNIQNKQISKFMHAWKNSNATSAAVEKVVCLFDLLSERSPTDYELFVAGKATLQNAIAVARSLGQTIESQTLIDRYAALPIKTSAELSIDGHFLMEKGIAAGPQLGKILTTIKENIIGGKLENNPEAVSDFIDSKNI